MTSLVKCIRSGFNMILATALACSPSIASSQMANQAADLIQPSDLKAHLYFLASDENSYIAGQEIVADGGFLCQ